MYNRPEHTVATLEALADNVLADHSELFIYCDGYASDASHTTIQDVQRVRKVIRERSWCKTVTIKESAVNLGLAESIIRGVTEIVNRFGRVIVLEDDIVPSVGFLRYMNDALNMYENEAQVGCIHAWNYPLNVQDYEKTTFFLKGADCWGWGTWSRAWDKFIPDGRTLLNEITTRKLEYIFNRRGTHDFINMLKDQIDGKNDSWAVRWHASLVIIDMYCLHPVIPLVKNIGLDGSGVHCVKVDLKQLPVNTICLSKESICDNEWFYEAYRVYQNKMNLHHIGIWERLKVLLSRFCRQSLLVL